MQSTPSLKAGSVESSLLLLLLGSADEGCVSVALTTKLLIRGDSCEKSLNERLTLTDGGGSLDASWTTKLGMRVDKNSRRIMPEPRRR